MRSKITLALAAVLIVGGVTALALRGESDTPDVATAEGTPEVPVAPAGDLLAAEGVELEADPVGPVVSAIPPPKDWPEHAVTTLNPDGTITVRRKIKVYTRQGGIQMKPVEYTAYKVEKRVIGRASDRGRLGRAGEDEITRNRPRRQRIFQNVKLAPGGEQPGGRPQSDPEPVQKQD